MAKQNYYYKCDVYSKVGRKLNKFWNKAVRAAQRADDYARKYGAESYVQPVQFFEGGVDYLEFGDATPDPRVWRKKLTSAEGHDEYEPNCMYRADVLVIPDNRFHPSNTWNKIYTRQHLTWKEAKPLKTLQQWAKIAHVELTKDREADAKAVDECMQKYAFVSYLEFYGDDGVHLNDRDKRTCPAWLRRAIRAEQDRQALPVVEVRELLGLLEVKISTQKKVPGKITAVVMSPSATPTFFVYGDSYYVCSEYPCTADGLHPITEGVFVCNKNTALRQQKAES